MSKPNKQLQPAAAFADRPASTVAEAERERDVVDRLIGLLAERHPELEKPDLDAFEVALREYFGGDRHWIRRAPNADRTAKVQRFLSEFNGRNASELARRLNIPRAEVYRIIKQPGRR